MNELIENRKRAFWKDNLLVGVYSKQKCILSVALSLCHKKAGLTEDIIKIRKIKRTISYKLVWKWENENKDNVQ